MIKQYRVANNTCNSGGFLQLWVVDSELPGDSLIDAAGGKELIFDSK